MIEVDGNVTIRTMAVFGGDQGNHGDWVKSTMLALAKLGEEP
jgi:hypothetical protein